MKQRLSGQSLVIQKNGNRFIENTDGTKTEAFIECECHKEWREQNRIEAEAKKAGLNPKWKDFDISKDYVGTSSINNVKRLQKYVDRFINEKDEKTCLPAACSTYRFCSLRLRQQRREKRPSGDQGQRRPFPCRGR